MAFSNWFQLIHDSFNLDELKLLCTELRIDFEDLSGQTKNEKIRSLLLYCQRQQRGNDLLTYCKGKRPLKTWPESFQETQLGVTPPIWERRWFIGLAIIMMLIIMIAIAAIAVSNIVGKEKLSEILFATSTPTILPEQPGETLIIIATFAHPDNISSPEFERQIKFSLDNEKQENGFDSLRAELVPDILKYEEENKGRELGEKYNASIVIWGNQASENVFYSLLNRRTGELDDITPGNPSIPPDYTQFVTTDLPNEIKFLSLFAIGQTYLSSHDYDKAIEMHEAAVKPLPENSTFEGLADAYYWLGWLYHVPKNEYTKAIEYLNKALLLDDEYFEAYFQRGIARRKLKDWDGAIEDYTKVIGLNQDYPNAYANLGAIQYLQGNLDEALGNYNKAISLDSSLDFAHGGRGRVNQELGNLEAARADYLKFIELTDDPELRQQMEERVKTLETELNQ